MKNFIIKIIKFIPMIIGVCFMLIGAIGILFLISGEGLLNKLSRKKFNINNE